MVSYVVIYFEPSIFILVVGVLLLVCCVRKCCKDRAPEVEVREVPDWVNSPRLLLHYYYMQSMYSLVWETVCRYFPSRQLEGPIQEIELGIV